MLIYLVFNLEVYIETFTKVFILVKIFSEQKVIDIIYLPFLRIFL